MSITAAVPPHRQASARDWCGLAVLSLAVVLISIDATVLDVAVPRISTALQPTSTELLWIIDIYSFVLAGLLVTMGTLGDRIGRRRLLLIGAASFGAASLLAAFAASPAMLIAARALQGIAGATLMPATLGLIRSTFADPRERTIAIAVWSAMAGGGAAAGPVLGGWLLTHFWWGSVFLVNVPIMAVLVIAGPAVIRESRDPHPGRFDIASAALSILAVAAIVYAVKETAAHGISSTSTVLGAGGVAAALLFVRRQFQLPDPLLDITLFRTNGFTTVVMTYFLAIFALAGVLFFGSQYLQAVLGYSPLTAGLLLLPGAAASALSALATPALRKYLSASRILTTGLGVSALGMGLLAFLPTGDGAALFVTGFTLAGTGIGVVVTLASDVVVSAVAPARAGAASAVAETAYELGAAMGVATIGSVVMSVYRTGIATGHPGMAQHEEMETISGALAFTHQLPTGQQEELLTAITSAFTEGVHWAAAITALVLLAAAGAAARLRVR